MNSSTSINRKAIFFASFMTLIAAGVGFSVRGAILGDWESAFGFTKNDLGGITGGGLVGFGIIILISSFFVDKIGYKAILSLAFLLHVISAVGTMAATWVFQEYGKDTTYQCLYWSMFIFAIANGLCEASINPLVADLYPEQKTHYLNILHAGWPGGLIVGGLFAYGFAGEGAQISHLDWKIPMAFFLVPTLIYGVIVLKEKFPLSHVRAAGVDTGSMFLQFASPVFICLLVLHAMVGYVELGTDSWITNIMHNIIESNAILLFIYTSGLMFILRFFAGPIVEKINPIGLLFISAILGAVGLRMLGTATTGGVILLAATVYGLGKTFLWPTMLGVVGERFPKGGALTMGALGGVGMLSAGLLGGPGIGYQQDHFASQNLQAEAPEVYEEFATQDTQFLVFDPIKAIDPGKVEEAKAAAGEEMSEADTAKFKAVDDARLFGGQEALKWTALVPAMMAVGYLILLIYFRAKGGYKTEVLHGEEPDGEHYTGGVEGPMEA